MAEMIEWQVGNGIEVHNTREKVWTRKDEQEDTRGNGCILVGVVI